MQSSKGYCPGKAEYDRAMLLETQSHQIIVQKYLLQSATFGYVPAKLEVVYRLMRGRWWFIDEESATPRHDPKKAYDILCHIVSGSKECPVEIEEADSTALFLLGHCYAEGIGCEKVNLSYAEYYAKHAFENAGNGADELFLAEVKCFGNSSRTLRELLPLYDRA